MRNLIKRMRNREITRNGPQRIVGFWEQLYDVLNH
jgi:hypothetical protein